MPIPTRRINIRVSRAQKAVITALARAAGLSVSAYLRRVSLAGGTADDEWGLVRLLAAVLASTGRATRAVDHALLSARASNRRTARLEWRHAAALRERVSLP